MTELSPELIFFYAFLLPGVMLCLGYYVRDYEEFSKERAPRTEGAPRQETTRRGNAARRG